MNAKLTTPSEGSQLLINPAELNQEQLETLEKSGKNILLTLQDYTILLGKHKVCAAILRKTRSDKEEIEKNLTTDALSDHGMKIAIGSMKFMVAGMEESLELLNQYKATISTKKNNRPRTSILARAIETIEKVCPSVDMERFLKDLKDHKDKSPYKILGNIFR